MAPIDEGDSRLITIRNLLAKAEATSFPAEAEAFTAKASELMARYAIDEAMLGRFVATGKDVMVEVCPKVEGDRGGIPVHANGKLQVLEEFRLPTDFDARTVRVFNTNTFLVRAEALATAAIDWSFFYVEKKVDGAVAVQFERLLQELTAALPSAYVEVPREGDGARFLPVKDMDELAARRAMIQRVARARGMV